MALHLIMRTASLERFTITPCSQKLVRSPRTTCGMATPPEKSSTPSPQHVYCGHTIIRKNNEGVRCCLSVCLPVCLPACLSVCLPVCLPACMSSLSVDLALRSLLIVLSVYSPSDEKQRPGSRGLLGCVYSGFTPNYADRFCRTFHNNTV